MTATITDETRAIALDDPTNNVLADMLTENTGRHFLDSGGAYGRSWERNQSAVAAHDVPAVAHFLDQPEAWQGFKGEEWATLSVFHWLRQRVEYHPAVDHAFRLWVYLAPDRTFNGGDTLEDFIDALKKKGWAEDADFGGGYTYNGECALSQDIVDRPFILTEKCPWVDFETEMVAVSIHGGCDARGGFTDYRMFDVSNGEGYYGMYDYADYYVHWECDKPLPDPNQMSLDGVEPPSPDQHTYTFDARAGDGQWYIPETGGEPEADPEELDEDDVPEGDEYGCARRCRCGGTLTIAGFEPPFPS